MPRGVHRRGGAAELLLLPRQTSSLFPNLAHFGYVVVFIFKSLPLLLALNVLTTRTPSRLLMAFNCPVIFLDKPAFSWLLSHSSVRRGHFHDI